MKKLSKKEAGFSLVELLIVVAIIGIIVALSASGIVNAKTSAGKSSTVAQLRGMYSAEQNYHIQNLRYANMTELIAQNVGFGAVTSNKIIKGHYTFQMTPLVPDVTSLTSTFIIEANGSDSGQNLKFIITEKGNITQMTPVFRNW